ncbi:MAG: hypothetical protein ACI4OT_03200 [Bacilli bacterium]
MKEAIGQTISLQVILIFLVFLNAFLAFSVNYTKAFRVKNKVINELEQNEGLNATARNNIINYIENVGYNVADKTGKTKDNKGTCFHGVCITPHCAGSLGTDKGSDSCIADSNKKVSNYRVYYTVETYININIPIINQILDQDIAILKVQGDTATVYTDASRLSDLLYWS